MEFSQITNFRQLKPSRKQQKPGNYFVYRLGSDLFRFGRVIRIGACRDRDPKIVLLYFYQAASNKVHPLPECRSDELLIHPVVTNHKPWYDGVFKTIAEVELRKEDVLPVHCFADQVTHKTAHPQFFNEYGERLASRVEPCGWRGISGYLGIDDKLSEAVGIPVIPIEKREAYFRMRGKTPAGF